MWEVKPIMQALFVMLFHTSAEIDIFKYKLVACFVIVFQVSADSLFEIEICRAFHN